MGSGFMLKSARKSSKLYAFFACAACLYLFGVRVKVYIKPKKAIQPINAYPSYIEPFRENVKVPDWCRVLMENPRPRPIKPVFGECGRETNGILCADGKPMFFGWKNEDYFLWSRHFRHLKRPGVFLDIAANEPMSMSNTFFFETCLGWKGACVEPNPKYLGPLRDLRTCALVTTCVSDRRHTVEFSLAGKTGGILDTNKNARDKLNAFNKTGTMECVKVSEPIDFLRIKKVDFMNLDVEGHEMFVLKGIDWKKVEIDFILTEYKHKEMKDFLQNKGFRLKTDTEPDKIDGLRGDWLFVHKRVKWGHPV